MEGKDAVLGSSVNFAVCTREVPPATDNVSTDCQKRYHRPTTSRNVDYSSRIKSSRISKASSTGAREYPTRRPPTTNPSPAYTPIAPPLPPPPSNSTPPPPP